VIINNDSSFQKATERPSDRQVGQGPRDGSEEGVREPPHLDELGDEIWVVLGGGGLKGLAHIGAWQALEEHGVPVRGIVGTSIGALVGGCLSGGMGWDELVAPALDLEREDIVRINRRAVWINGIRAESLFRGEVLREYIEGILPIRRWEELSLPLLVNAVDLETGVTEWFGTPARTDVPPVEAIYASAALPVFYPPARVGEAYLVDGGVEDSLPLDRAREAGASGIVAVDAGAGEMDDAGSVVDQGMVGIHQRVYSIMSGRRRRESLAAWTGPPLLRIRPRLDGFSTFDFESVQYFLEEGYRAARRALSASE